jgi:Uma2 family endonuclease
MEPTELPPGRATYEDLKRVPDHLVAQLIDGELIVHPRPASAHTRAASQLGAALIPPFSNGSGGPGGWEILDEPELHLGEDILIPDLAGWRRERMPRTPETPYFTLAPDWVCEVLSPSTAALDCERKMPLYARAGVRHVWLVDPKEHTLDVYRLDTGSYAYLTGFSDEDLARAEPFDVLELKLELLWLR